MTCDDTEKLNYKDLAKIRLRQVSY